MLTSFSLIITPSPPLPQVTSMAYSLWIQREYGHTYNGDGKILMKDHEIITMDEKRVYSEDKKIGSRCVGTVSIYV
jgi:hypothetical protein